jgi:hypothetical protein
MDRLHKRENERSFKAQDNCGLAQNQVQQKQNVDAAGIKCAIFGYLELTEYLIKTRSWH